MKFFYDLYMYIGLNILLFKLCNWVKFCSEIEKKLFSNVL